jgi:DNA-binding transcriptional ArsR family regulator
MHIFEYMLICSLESGSDGWLSGGSMPSRLTIARELSDIFKVIGHPDRVRIIEELRSEQKDVSTLAKETDLPQTRVSQHLALLRSHRLVEEHREGRHHVYSLTQPEIAQWIVAGIRFIELRGPASLSVDANEARLLWS